MDRPDLLILGQITLDHVVPAAPGPWAERVGGNALYAAAGARLWLDPARIGLVFRRGPDFPIDVEAVLATAGIVHVRRIDVERPHLTEWIVYETSGSRRCLPKNTPLQHIGAEGEVGDVEVYLDYLLAFTPQARDFPEDWLPAKAVHLAPQVRDRHPESLAFLKGRAGFLSVDPSPFLAKRHDAGGLAGVLAGANAILPSELEAGHLAGQGWEAAARDLHAAGFAEAIIKRGGEEVVLATAEGVSLLPVTPVPLADPTGAGDSFGGAYAACRMLGLSPREAVRRAIVSAGMVVGTEGAQAALALDPDEAARRLAASA
ncbi:hypothetical protein ASG43_12025 [Aureimonas sp. Leaf454]|uniref:carbohydrate kinase family protein n=1 Tax=Aureimonas sp. Leaf454 TaxID=1736381 RepID=UPI0006F76872|nr:carbohydrate kinase family protein [Aureimonas sp. Leaf454]KQT46342.1 hypothetical protein ASG43_12025 [Aureimonas sp. Leaf454]